MCDFFSLGILFQSFSQFATLQSPNITIESSVIHCPLATLTFWFHAYGTKLKYFNVEATDVDGTYTIYRHVGDSDNEWKQVSETFRPSGNFTVSTCINNIMIPIVYLIQISMHLYVWYTSNVELSTYTRQPIQR